MPPADLHRATGLAESAEADSKRLNRVLQLTGFSDPVYAEAYVTVHQYDIVMDVTVVNRASETLQVGGRVWGGGGHCTVGVGGCTLPWGAV